jgi:NADP-dependent alcohol dehydrogenase
VLNFDFHNPTRILFGEGQVAALAERVPAGARVLVLYGGGSIRNISCQALELAL